MKKKFLEKRLKKKLAIGVLAGVSICMLAAGCGKKKEDVIPESAITQEEESEPEPESDVIIEAEIIQEEGESREGEAKSLLTGEWVDEELAKKRPISCMIGNTDAALPQFGVGKADVIYEAPVEGGLTRIMGFFQDYEGLEQLGSVRSSRLYFAYYSQEFDAIYLHYGQAEYARNFLESGQIDDLNGLDYAVDQAVIYRDNSKSAPHNAYATGKGLVAGIELKGYDTVYPETMESHYHFAEEEEPVELTGSESKEAGMIQPGYQINKPWFEYHAEDGLYYRYQYGSKHIDGTTGEQLAVKNIILQDSNVRTLDDNGYLEIDTTGEGTGQYITNGRAIDITWSRSDVFSPTHYYDSTGNEITLNPGKTWVCIIDNKRLDKVQFAADAALVQ